MLELKKSMNVFKKIELIEQEIKLELGFDDFTNIAKELGRVSHSIRGNIYELSEREKLLYGFLLRHNLNHRTVYAWFLLKNAPSEVKNKVIDNFRRKKQHAYSLRKAREDYTEIKRLRLKPQDKLILSEIKSFIRRVV